MKKPTFREKLRYAFDNTLSRGTIALIGWLALVSAALIVAIAVIVRLTRIAPDYGLPQLIWMGLMRTLDAGTMGGDQGHGRTSSRCWRSPWGASSSSAR